MIGWRLIRSLAIGAGLGVLWLILWIGSVDFALSRHAAKCPDRPPVTAPADGEMRTELSVTLCESSTETDRVAMPSALAVAALASVLTYRKGVRRL